MKAFKMMVLATLLVAVPFYLILLLISGVLMSFDDGVHRDHHTNRVIMAKKEFVDFDQRTKFKLVSDMQSNGIDIQPSILPEHVLRQPSRNDDELFPLSGLVDQLTVMCNEGGQYTIYCSDRYGFHNDDAVYELESVDAVLIGDSFVHGSCVASGVNIAGHLSRQKLSVVNFGMGGNGPLIELATLREYGRVVKPKNVLWFFYEYNDLNNLRDELDNPLLKRYLMDETFSQNLSARRQEVQSYLTRRILEPMLTLASDKAPMVPMRLESKWQLVKRVLAVKDVRLAVRRWYKNVFYDSALGRKVMEARLVREDVQALKKILQQAKQFSEEQLGAKFYFVYLPSHMEFSSGYRKYRNVVLSVVESLQIPIIDFRKVLNAQPDPLLYFPYRVIGHYTPQGYELLAKQVNKEVFEMKEGVADE